MDRLALLALLASDALAAAHAWSLRGRLPPVVASHFDAAGRANGWMPRGAFVGFYLGAVALVTVVFVIVALAPRIPGARINLPHRDHWLAPERRDETFAWISGWGYAMGTVTVWLLIAIMRLAARANEGLPGAMENAPILLAAFGAAALVLLGVMLAHFRDPTG